MTAATAGPWRFYTEPQPNGCPIVGDGRGLMVAMLAHSVNEPQQKAEAIANAKLIAAAPEMRGLLAAFAPYIRDSISADLSNGGFGPQLQELMEQSDRAEQLLAALSV